MLLLSTDCLCSLARLRITSATWSGCPGPSDTTGQPTDQSGVDTFKTATNTKLQQPAKLALMKMLQGAEGGDGETTCGSTECMWQPTTVLPAGHAARAGGSLAVLTTSDPSNLHLNVSVLDAHGVCLQACRVIRDLPHERKRWKPCKTSDR